MFRGLINKKINKKKNIGHTYKNHKEKNDLLHTYLLNSYNIKQNQNKKRKKMRKYLKQQFYTFMKCSSANMFVNTCGLLCSVKDLK